jgi:glucose/mannose-6-phosphate isomerase
MLDDLQKIHERDPQDALGVSGRQWEYLSRKFDTTFEPTEKVTNVVLGGMGGSALYGVLVGAWPRLNVPFEIVRTYDIPAYVGPSTLFVASSYSGNTEETLEALEQAEAKHAQIVVIASGGKLADKARDKGYPLYEVPGGIQPRMATLYLFSALVQVLSPLGVCVADTSELDSLGDWLKPHLDGWGAAVPTSQNQAKQIAQELMGKTLVMYSGPLMFGAANKWKMCANENAKNTSWVYQYPEFNHNEFIGWASHPVDKPFAVVEIRSNLEHPRVQKRFEISERLLSGLRPAPIVVGPEGETVLQQLAYAVAMGDFVGTYLALLNGVNPTPVDLVEKLKVELNQ